jgi:hypothetical protein
MSGVGSSAHDSLGELELELVMGDGQREGEHEVLCDACLCLAGFLRLGQHAKHSPRFARQGSFSSCNLGPGPPCPVLTLVLLFGEGGG